VAFPMPDRLTDCGEPVALSTIIRWPISAVVSSIGVKVTATLQLLPGASILSHRDFTAKTAGVAVSISTLTAGPVFLWPLFLIVTSLALLGFPISFLSPKLSDEGLTDTVPTGVSVAVGVAVAVRVAVGVAVGVAVAVAVRVAVAVAVAVGVATPDPVAVGVGVAVAV